jgi:hypothetical protein
MSLTVREAAQEVLSDYVAYCTLWDKYDGGFQKGGLFGELQQVRWISLDNLRDVLLEDDR